MKIDLLPWVISETSLKLPSKRRRTRKSTDTSFGVRQPALLENSLSMVATFIDPTSVLPSWQWTPTISLTLSHKVILTGPSSRKDSPHHHAGRNSEMLYLSRPTSKHSFISEEESSSAPPIPCLCTKSRLYACWDTNRRLVSWGYDQTPEEGVSKELTSAAVSLSVHRDLFAYGSLQDGSLFIARHLSNKPLEVEYVSCKAPSGAQHVATFLEAKRDTAPDSFFQIFFHQCNLLIRRHGGCLSKSSTHSSSKCKSIPLEQGASGVHLVGQNQDSVVVSYQNGNSELVCCKVDLSQARVVKKIRLDINDKRLLPKLGLVRSFLLVVTRSEAESVHNDLRVFDMDRGALLSQGPLHIECDQVVSLITDSKNQIALVALNSDTIVVAVSSLLELQSVQEMTLSEGVSTTVTSDLRSMRTRTDKYYHDIPSIGDPIEVAIQRLRNAQYEIQRYTDNSMSETFLSSAYYDATQILFGGRSTHATDVFSMNHVTNPQEPSEKVNGNRGVKPKSKSLPPNEYLGLNGVDSRANVPEPRVLPPSFVDAAARIFIEILTTTGIAETTRNDARICLRRFLRTGLLSSRRPPPRFASLTEALEVTEGAGKTSYSPVDLIFDFHRHCSDLNERQLVASVQYVFSSASARDLYTFMRRNAKQGNPVTHLLDRLDEIRDRRSCTDNDGREWLTSLCKLALATVSELVTSISTNSDCNESMMRIATAMSSSRSELVLFCRTLIRCLSSSILSGSSQKRLMQLLSIVCEVLCEFNISDSEKAEMKRVEKWISAEVLKTENTLQLKAMLDTAIAEEQRATASAKKASADRNKKGVASCMLQYQIERITF